MNDHTFTREQDIINHLILRSPYLPDTGLFNGKTGIALFFLHYYRTTRHPVFEDHAFDLVDDVCGNLQKDMPLGLEGGLCGIGWGLEYMIYQRFMDGEDDLCGIIDSAVKERNPRYITDFCLKSGILGILHYIFIRIKNTGDEKDPPFDRQWLSDLQVTLQSHLIGKPDAELKKAAGKLDRYLKTGNMDYEPDAIGFCTKKITVHGKISSLPPGLHDGLSGYMLKQTLK